MTVTITSESGPSGTYFRWRAEHEGRLLVSRTYESHAQASREADELAPAMFRVLSEPKQDAALHELATITSMLLREGHTERALALHEAISMETGWTP